MATGKKLINSVESCVEDNLEGYVALNPGVRQVEGHPGVVIRADYEELQREGKVAVLCGGGSGHEPAYAGYVGRGMLAAVAMGPVFACPPASLMLAAIRAVGRHNPAGCLMLIPNYTGDRLNFGLAAERAQGEGIRIATHVIGEDCALTTNDKSAGRRGLTGIPVTIKIAGALAEEGRRLEDIVPILQTVLSNMASIGVALSPCYVPGSGPTFSLPHDEMELGLGVHGEAGVRRLKMMSAKDTVAAMLGHMTSPDNANRLSLHKGDRVAVFINDLGGISHMELNIIAKEAIQYLESRGIVVVRALCSPFVTSLEMAGTHVTVLRVDDDITRYLEEGEGLRAMLSAACRAVVSQESTLNALDTGAGDGDCGATLARGARLYGLFFHGVAAGLSQADSSDPWTQALRQGMDRMTRYGGAEPGDRTMAAEKGAESTREMKARAGRASYVSSSLLQQPDAGAVGVATWLRAAYTAYMAPPTSS